MEASANSEVIVAATIPSLFCLALLLGFTILSLLYYFKLRKIRMLNVSNSCSPQVLEVTYEELQKSTMIDHAITDMEAVKMDMNGAYGSMNVKDMAITDEDTSYM